MPASERPEEMARFFDARAAGYEEHMWGLGPAMADFYRLVAEQVAETRTAVRLLDLGIGTGLELNGIFARAPNAIIHGIDLSRRMLGLLKRNHADRRRQIRLYRRSYETCAWPGAGFDYVVSVMTLHHLPPGRKLQLYRRIREALRDGGLYIEGDYTVSEEQEREGLVDYERLIVEHGLNAAVAYHIDVPLCAATQVRLLTEAGFAGAKIVWEEDAKAVFTACR
ncbi:MAG: class I SAM-dependent methyltransferase [Patescibacteria group bacterium]